MPRSDPRNLSFGKASRLSAGVVAAFTATLLYGQQPEPQFEVASIHPTAFASDAFAAGFRAGAAKTPCGGGKLSIAGTLVSVTTASICSIVRIAYDVRDYQVIGMPAALDISDAGRAGPSPLQSAIASEAKHPPDFFDIVARSPGSKIPTEDEARAMLRALLRDRFRLALHRENRELPFYALVAAKGGPKLKPAVKNCKPTRLPAEVLSICGQTTEQIANYLNTYADRRVIDMTGIAGKFDYEIPIDLNSGNFGDSLLAGIQTQLKLKLEPRKGPVEVVFIDHIERPSEN
jgi:hypothetical protein